MESSRTHSDRDSQSWKAMLSSVGLHFILIATLILLLSFDAGSRGGGGEPDRAAQIVLTQITSDATTYESNDSAADEAASSAAVESPAELPQTFEAFELPQPVAPDIPGAAVNLENLDASRMTRDRTQSREQVVGLSKEQLDRIAEEQRALAARKPAGPPTDIQVFGSGDIRGSRFVFVLDRSASMGGGGLGVLQRAMNELSSSIESLTPEHMFQIVAYHNQSTLMNQRSMLYATDENKAQVKDFIGNLAAYGATQHEAGLYTALALQPDVIVFLTDGGYPVPNGGQIEAFCNAARRRVTVHAIQFGTAPDVPANSFMRSLADKTGGSYLYVDVTQWRR